MTATADPATTGEIQTIVAARRLEHARSVFIGVGRPSTAAILARMVHNPALVLVYESGTIGAKPFHIPLSIGDAIWEAPSGRTIEEVLAEADRTMYEAKRKRSGE